METIKLWNAPESAGTGRAEDDFEPYLELYLQESPETARGAVLVCPGGGYCNRAPHEAGPIAEQFRAQGFHAFVLQYRVAPYRYPAEQRDLFRAIRLIRSRAAQWNLNPSQLAVLGFSAGGHLAASGGTLFDEVDASAGDAADREPSRPDALILCYPVINVTEEFGHRGSGKNLLGEKFGTPEALRFNLETRVTAETPPAFLWHTADDNVVNVANSLLFAEALWKNGVTAELHVFPHGRHGLGLAPEAPDIAVWPELAGRFLRVSCGFACGC